jgi:hypothetical protein
VTITVQVRNVYGNDLVYPLCEKAKAFAAIANQKTLSHSVLCKIEALGYTIVNQAVSFRR